ncbi:MAG: hypothetical protein K9J21_10505 [Bacteroidales bacterium]|nr:hypothetical protein [Bacteroidales bacterium]
MKGNRPKIKSESLPDMEVRHHEIRHEVRWNFKIKTDTDEQDITRESFDYDYVKVYELTEQSLRDAGVPGEVIEKI